MQILVDDRPYAPTGAPDQTIRQLADEVMTTAGEGGRRMVVGLRCDGQQIADQDLDAVLDSVVSHYQQVEFLTGPTHALVTATLSQVIDSFQEAMASRNRIADLLAAGQMQPAMEGMAGLVGALKQAQQAVALCAQAMHIDIATLASGGVSLDSVLNELKVRLGELKDAMAAGDIVLVGDLLRYELEPPLTAWLAILLQMKAAAEAQAP